MPRETTVFDPADYLDTPEAVAAYLEAAFADGDPAEIADSLGVVARARGMSALARETGMARQSLYKALGDGGNPSFANVLKITKALGLKLSLQPG
jgi:probable addiction module antidote protein